ncbi:hypothetical protein BOX15_Mlig026060g2 [Macrostomum lignano]|uniref:Sema domain-containing protein n=1 Tax=Macrostomum lignano TaxID=282301 RepID=A0A267EQU7_9PLAT|nr:hypothetical protein BOX15_Mlig026060g2 [Macrostomum lignano]
MHYKIIIIFSLIVLLTIWSATSSYAIIFTINNRHFFSFKELKSQLTNVTLNGGSIKLVASIAGFYYLGGFNALYRVSCSGSSNSPQLVAAVGSETRPVTVKYLYILGDPASAAFVCSYTAQPSGLPMVGATPSCILFNVTAELPWKPVNLTNRQTSTLLTGFLMPNSPHDPERISLRLNGSHAFISNYPQVQDTLDIIELRWPRFDRIGWLTADFLSRRNREAWISRLAQPVAMATRGEKLYALFVEEAFEASNYYSSVSGEAFRTSTAVLKLPRFTRLARICLNDPGGQQPYQDMRIMTSFFKLRLICRNGSVDYDVLERVTEVSQSDPGTFYGLFSLQNSPSPAGHRALCRFTLAEAEALIGSSDFIQLEQSGLLSYTAKRLSRAAYAAASGRPRPTLCEWTPEEARQLKLSNLKVEHTAPLMARPLISNSLVTFDAAPVGQGGVASLCRVAETEQGDVLAVGTYSGSLIKFFVPAASSSSASSSASLAAAAAHQIETLQLFPPGSGARIDSLSAGAGRLFAVSDSAGAAVWLAESRCNRQAGCVACVALRDPRCSWRLDLRECAFAAEPEGLTNASSGHHSGCPISSRDLNSRLPSLAPPTRGASQTSALPPLLGASGGSLTDSASLAAAMNSGGVSGVPVGKFVAALIALCLLGFSAGFFLGCFVRRRRNLRRDVGRGGADGSAAEREKCIGEVPADCHGAAAAAAAGDVPLRLRRSQHGERSHQAVSNEYTEHPPQAVASYATPPAVPAVMRIVSSHSSALDSWQSCSADVPAIDDVDEDEEENSGMHTRRGQPIGDHRDNDWRHI